MNKKQLYNKNYSALQRSMGLCIYGDKERVASESTPYCHYHKWYHAEKLREYRSRQKKLELITGGWG